MAIGGFVDRVRERELLRSFVREAGGAAARLVVLALSPEPVEIRDVSGTAEHLREVFQGLAAKSVEVLRLGTAAGRSRLDLMEDATGLFLAGGGTWLPLPADLPLGEIVRRRHLAGLVVGGTGAGAALLPAFSIAPGSGLGERGQRRSLGLAPGLGLTSGLLLDPIPRQRDRLSRLLLALDRTDDSTPLAIGIDDETAVVLDPVEHTFEVQGLSAVTVVDATAAVRPGRAAAHPGDVPPMLGLRIDVLTAGCRYDLLERQSHPGTVHGAHGFSSRAPEPEKPQGE